MRNLYLLLSTAACFVLCFAISYDTQEVRIKSSDVLMERSKQVHKILSNKPIHIIFDGFDVKYLSCMLKKNGMLYSLPSTIVNFNNGSSILKTPGLTDNVKATLECTVKSLNGVITNVQINIESVFRILSVVNGVPLRYHLRETPEYEGITYHLCEEGQAVDLTCSKYLNYGRLKLKYYDQNGTKMVETDEVASKDPLNFRLLARVENHHSYVDCIHIDGARRNRAEFTFRVIFIVNDKNRNKSNFIVTINGIKLTSLVIYPTTLDLSEIYTYHYKFIYSDTLNITCENSNKDIVTDIVASLKTNPQMIKSVDFKQTKSLYSPHVQVYLVKTKFLDKAIMEFNFRVLNEKMTYKALIKFDMDDHDDPVILGLTQSNVLYQYNKSATEWFIHYKQCMVTEVLRLTCVAKKNSFLQWIHGENIVSPVFYNVGYGTRFISYDFNTDTKAKEIICEARSIAGTRRITVVLHKIPDILSQENKNETVSEKQSKTFEIIGISVGFLLVVMCAFCCWRVKRRALANKEKRLARNACGDANRVDDFTDQTECHEYAVIEYSDTTHSDVLNVNKGSSIAMRAPAPPPRSALPAKNTRLQLPPRGCISHGETNHSSSIKCTHIENEYDYIYEL